MRRKAVHRYDYEVRERSQSERTRHRREDRSRRKQMIAVMTLVFVGLAIASGPSLISHSPLGRSFLAQTLDSFGWQAEAAGLQVGWVTPFQATGVKLVGERSGSIVEIGELQTSLTLPQLMSSELKSGRFGELVLRDVRVACSVDTSTSSVEEDLAVLMAPSESPTEVVPEGAIQIQGLQVDVTDAVTKETWSLSQSNASVRLEAEQLQSQWQGVLTQPGGGEGSMQGTAAVGLIPNEGTPVQLEVESDSLPLSVVRLVARRFPESQLPAEITGDLSGSTRIELPASGHPSISLRKIEVRGLAAFDPVTRERLWSNELTQLDGDWMWMPGRIVARQMSAKTDFATLAMNGEFSDSFSISGTNSNPLVWLDQVDATADILVDLPRLHAAMPGILPMRQGAVLHRGTLRATIEPLSAGNVSAVNPRDHATGKRRRRLVVQSEAIEATSDGKPIRIAPMNATAVVASNATELSAERFEMQSPFARIEGQGDIASGAAELSVNFGKLAQMLRPIFELDNQNLQGDVRASLRWDAEANGLWRLQGSSQVDNLAIEISPGQRLQQRHLVSTLDVEGKWSVSSRRWSLDELSRGSLRLQGDGMQTDVDLVQTIGGLDQNQLIPVRVRGRGQIESVSEMLAPWMPESMIDCRGGFDFTARASISGTGNVLVQAVDGQVSSLRVPMSDQEIRQELVKLHFDGRASWPQNEVVVQSMTVTGDAASAAIQGELINNRMDLEIAWLADLDRLQTSASKRLAREPQQRSRTSAFNRSNPASTRMAAFNSDSNASNQWDIGGKLEGNTIVVGDTVHVHLDTQIAGRDVVLSEPGVGRNRSHSSVVWSEPAIQIDGDLDLDLSTQAIRTDALQVSTDWCGTTLAGTVAWREETADVHLRGPARFKMDEVGRRLTALTGTTIVAEGLHETPVEIRYAQNSPSDYAFTVKGNLGWETVDTAGMLFGPAEVPFRMTESVVSVNASRIPVLGPSRLTPRMIGPQVAPLSDQPVDTATGKILLAGDVHYRPELYIEMKPGPIARGVALTPDMTGKWLKYLAPIAADAARVEGTFSAELQQARVWVDDPSRSEVRGRLEIERVQMNAGPLADQVIASARQLQALAAIGSAASPPRTGRTLITMPAQSVEFQVSQGAVNHRALMFDVDRARVVTSGQVDFDGRLDLIAQIPLDARWLGSDLRGLAGQTMTLPIDGTLSRPSLDSAGIRRVVADFGVQAAQQAAQDAAGNFLQQQFGRGQQQLEEGINKGLEKLRFDKLFGN
ncbi:MAG: hypothetical protein ACF8CQ_03030 [Rhodopirellula sp. JB044]|uniref:hypothetical protein n=1 Tax=Rhodopirellula sp. JB044 TaxID=3342844 RepID=UPI00370A1E5B